MNASRQLTRGTLAAVSLLLSLVAHAGGSLETVDITAGNVTVPGTIDGDLIPIEWDARCIPVNFTLDNTPPNALSFPAQTVDINTTRTELQTAMEQWNRLRTSFIRFNVTAVRDLNGGVLTPQQTIGAFDFINELNFVTQGGFLAAAPSVSLIKDTTLTAGQDIDLDGDSDVFAPSDAMGRTCRDVDADGDFEFPAGFYEAGTILETDVGFAATNGVPWNTTPDAAITADIQGVAVHEFGHSHGLSHSLINQISRRDGSGATMFPFIDINDPGAEEAQRSLAMDDIAWSSFLYPEGSASFGPGALQPGDRRFTAEFGLVRGQVTSGSAGGPVVGANVWLQDARTGEVVVSGFSGTARLLVVPGPTGSTDFDAAVDIGPPDFSIVNGNYVIPAPAGFYKVGLQSLDMLPASPGNISFTAIVGSLFTDLDFHEEFWNKPFENARETRPGDARPVHVARGHTRHVDFETNIVDKLTLGFFDPTLFDGFCCVGETPGTFLAVRYSNAKARAFLAGSVLHSAEFLTDVVDASVPVLFKSAILTTGRVTGERTASIDLNSPLQKVSPFLAQDTDFSPWYFKLPTLLTRYIEHRLERSPDTDLFVVLELPDAPLPGVSGRTPVVGFDFEGDSNSYRSTDGGVTFRKDDFGLDWFFDLVSTP